MADDYDLMRRRPDCSNYPTCLAEAARLNAGGLACRSCRRYRPADSLWLYHCEIDGLLPLLLALEDEPGAPHTYPLIWP